MFKLIYSSIKAQQTLSEAADICDEIIELLQELKKEIDES